MYERVSNSGGVQEEAQAAVNGLDGEIYMARPLKVDISQPYSKAKKDQTTIFTSASPEPASVQSPLNASEGPSEQKDYKDRTIALMNIPDTVNDARVRTIAEVYGPLVKIKLMPSNKGAFVEFKNKSDAAKATLALGGIEIVPGRTIRVGTVEELKKTHPVARSDEPAVHKKNSNHIKSAGPISRPIQPGSGRRGGHGGLGIRKRVVGRLYNGKEAETGNKETLGNLAEKGKSNDDFRAMISGGQDVKDTTT
jgi:squamous cell carcinoma antigen recognized by T-cells 3